MLSCKVVVSREPVASGLILLGYRRCIEGIVGHGTGIDELFQRQRPRDSGR